MYWDYCGPHMICMERMSGVPMDDFAAIAERGVDGFLTLRRGVKVWLEAAVVHGCFHGDVHAGNLWVLDDGRATYLDFGIMGEVPDEWRDLLKDLFYTSMIDGDFTRIARAFKRVGAFPEEAGSDEEVAAAPRHGVRPDARPRRRRGEPGRGLQGHRPDDGRLRRGEPAGARARHQAAPLLRALRPELAPDWALARDLYLVKNIFPEAVKEKAAKEGPRPPGLNRRSWHG